MILLARHGMTLGFFTKQYRTVLEYGGDMGFTLPDLSIQIEDNVRIKEMIKSGLWEMEDLMYFMNRGSAEFSRINYKNPSAFYLSLIGTPSWNTSGFAGTAANGLNTGWTPSEHAVAAQVDRNATTMRITTEAPHGNHVCGANHNTIIAEYLFNPCRAAPDRRTQHNNNSATMHALYINENLNSLGKWTVGRANVGSHLYLARDSTMLLNPGSIGSGVLGWPNRPFYLLGSNNGTYLGSNRRMSYFSIGYHKTPTQITQLHSLIP